MSTNTRRVLFLLAFIGLASAVASLYVHVQMLRNPGYLSFCDVNATISCTQVYQSRYASLYGVPVALLGALWYLGVLVVLAGAQWGWPSLRESAAGYVFVLATFGLGFVIYMAYASLVLLKTVCLMCLVTYVAVAGIFVVSGMRTSYPMTTIPRRLWQDMRAAIASPAALVLVLVFVIGASTAVAFFPSTTSARAATASQTPADKQSEFVRFWDTQTRVQVPVSADGAAVLIVKFSDYQCPACAQSYLDYKSILARYIAQYPGAIKLVTKDYPLETECNSNMPRDMHPAACEAAVAARLARLKGRGEAMEDWLYTNHTSLTPASVRQAARDVGGVTDFDAAYPAMINQVKSDIALATILGIKVTPTFFINGVKLEGGLPLQYFELALQLELKKAGKTTP
ncbi:MAG: thioredoxin domain-containing protein [Acidobacteria bacterium]|nr:thioredoxin domain-containing protein [Acidobacteriota bacterium]